MAREICRRITATKDIECGALTSNSPVQNNRETEKVPPLSALVHDV